MFGLWISCGWGKFFFVEQKTAYEVRISDWSSDVCSSDLALEQAARQRILARARREHGLQMIETRIARHDRRRMAQRRQHVAIEAEIADSRGPIDKSIRIVGAGGARTRIPNEQHLRNVKA